MSDKYVNVLEEVENAVSDGSIILSTWESDFIASIRTQIDVGRIGLSQKQKDKLKDIYEEKVMKW